MKIWVALIFQTSLPYVTCAVNTCRKILLVTLLPDFVSTVKHHVFTPSTSHHNTCLMMIFERTLAQSMPHDEQLGQTNSTVIYYSNIVSHQLRIIRPLWRNYDWFAFLWDLDFRIHRSLFKSGKELELSVVPFTGRSIITVNKESIRIDLRLTSFLVYKTSGALKSFGSQL